MRERAPASGERGAHPGGTARSILPLSRLRRGGGQPGARPSSGSSSSRPSSCWTRAAIHFAVRGAPSCGADLDPRTTDSPFLKQPDAIAPARLHLSQVQLRNEDVMPWPGESRSILSHAGERLFGYGSTKNDAPAAQTTLAISSVASRRKHSERRKQGRRPKWRGKVGEHEGSETFRWDARRRRLRRTEQSRSPSSANHDQHSAHF